jgi:hypothetical protein
MQVAFAGRSWSASRGQQLKPTCQRSRHQGQLETLGGQIGSICAMRVSSRGRSGYKALPVILACRLVIVSSVRHVSWLLSDRNSTYPAVQISSASSSLIGKPEVTAA